MEKVRVHVFVEGKVQAVFYRTWTFKQACDLGLTGWARNIEDGRVEVVAEGEKKQIDKLIRLIKIGPPLAKVNHLDIIWEKKTGEFEGFEIIH